MALPLDGGGDTGRALWGHSWLGEKDNPSVSVTPRAGGRTLGLRQEKGSLEPELLWGEHSPWAVGILPALSRSRLECLPVSHVPAT